MNMLPCLPVVEWLHDCLLNAKTSSSRKFGNVFLERSNVIMSSKLNSWLVPESVAQNALITLWMCPLTLSHSAMMMHIALGYMVTTEVLWEGRQCTSFCIDCRMVIVEGEWENQQLLTLQTHLLSYLQKHPKSFMPGLGYRTWWFSPLFQKRSDYSHV